MRLELQLLGSPQIWLDGKPVTASRRAVIALLAYLTVTGIEHPRQRHTRESLSALFWTDYDQAKALTNLRHTLWEVTQFIGEGWINADHETIYLNPHTDLSLDVAQFRSLLTQAAQESDLTHRVPLLVAATKLYRDDFLTGFSLRDGSNFNEWVALEAEDLRRGLASSLNRLVDDHRALHQAEAALAYAQRLVSRDPINETAHRQLMQLYALTDQHTAAIQQYQTLEKLLRKEFNLDPQPETRELYKRIRRKDLKSVSPEVKADQLERALPRHNLPVHLTSFIGREKERQEIGRLLTNNRLVTLLGAGGIGKTRLSVRTGQTLLDRYPDGVWFIALDSVTDEKLVAQRVASVFGVVDAQEQSVVQPLVAVLQSQTALLILDNCEHLVESCAQLVESLLKSCPKIDILVTSREVLGVEGECLYMVSPLSIPTTDQMSQVNSVDENESIQLFVERSRLVFPNFGITEKNRPMIVEICNYLDGIPLAIELAAARTDVFRADEILQQLHHSFDLLAVNTRSTSPRHQTLRASIDWSWNLLSEGERIFLMRLSVFAGGWTFPAAQAVAECENIDWISSLVKKSFLVVSQDERHETRYDLHNVVRKYAWEKLLEAGEELSIRDRHLAYVLYMFGSFEAGLRGVDQLLWLERLFLERDNIRVAMQWAAKTNVEAGLYLSGRLRTFWADYDLPEEKRWLLMI